MTRVKICGITNVEDATAAVELGADALGFILVRESPRYVPETELESLTCSVPPMVARIGVCQELQQSRPEWTGYFDAMQIYAGTLDAARWPRGIRALRIQSEIRVEEVELACEGANALLLDAYHPEKLGGSGEIFDWDIAAAIRKSLKLPVILAGGLTPANVGEAVRRVRPFAVDVSTGVEKCPGRKDPAKIKAFLKAVQQADSDLATELGI